MRWRLRRHPVRERSERTRRKKKVVDDCRGSGRGL